MSTVVELRKVAKENGLKGYSKMKKDELIELLKGVKKEEKAPIKKSRMTKNKDVHVLTPREKKEKKKKEEEEKERKTDAVWQVPTAPAGGGRLGRPFSSPPFFSRC